MQTAAPALEFAGFADEIQRIGQEAVQEAQDNLRRKGIPLCFSRNGRIYYEMPDGSIQTENPYPALLRARATELRARGIMLPDETGPEAG